MKQVVTITTRNTDKTQSLLDLILTNAKYISSAGTLEHYISDHQPIFVIKKKGRDNRPKMEFEVGHTEILTRRIFSNSWLRTTGMIILKWRTLTRHGITC